jgi:hypothetical protein
MSVIWLLVGRVVPPLRCISSILLYRTIPCARTEHITSLSRKKKEKKRLGLIHSIPFVRPRNACKTFLNRDIAVPVDLETYKVKLVSKHPHRET